MGDNSDTDPTGPTGPTDQDFKEKGAVGAVKDAVADVPWPRSLDGRRLRQGITATILEHLAGS